MYKIGYPLGDPRHSFPLPHIPFGKVQVYLHFIQHKSLTIIIVPVYFVMCYIIVDK